jgi:hypothetical protein
MTARSRELLDRWLAELMRVVAALTSDTLRDADANMSVFSISDARANGVAPAELDDFLLRAYRHFSRTLSKLATDGWFYAWHDEVSGTLRCSICRASNATQLPFACRLNVVGQPSPVTGAALGSSYGDGIPGDELVAEMHWQEDEAREDEFVLTVFARPLIAEV